MMAVPKAANTVAPSKDETPSACMITAVYAPVVMRSPVAAFGNRLTPITSVMAKAGKATTRPSMTPLMSRFKN